MLWMVYRAYLDQLVDGGERGLPVRVEGSGHVRGDGESGRLALEAGGVVLDGQALEAPLNLQADGGLLPRH